jgi:hypothetical protein
MDPALSRKLEKVSRKTWEGNCKAVGGKHIKKTE